MMPKLPAVLARLRPHLASAYAAGKLEIVEDEHRAHVESIGKGQRVVRVVTPGNLGAMARHARMHEAAHTRHRTHKDLLDLPPWVRNWAEDLWVEHRWTPRGGQCQRDRVTAARAMIAGLPPPDLPATLLATGGDHGLAYVNRILGGLSVAMSIIPPSDPDHGIGREWLGAAGMPPGLLGLGSVALHPMRRSREWLMTEGARRVFVAPVERSDARRTERREDAADTRSGRLDGMDPMDVVELEPRVRSVTTMRERKRVYEPSGARMHMPGVVRALSGGSPSRAYRRRRIKRIPPQGTILLDVSGSMGRDAERIRRICDRLPTATVAYYSGRSKRGKLCVVARDGRMYMGPLPMHAGNEIDYWAIRWLLGEPGPRTLVTDEGFVGGPRGQGVAALNLLRSVQNRADFTLIHSLDALETSLGLPLTYEA
jgi:hypothetical protein